MPANWPMLTVWALTPFLVFFHAYSNSSNPCKTCSFPVWTNYNPGSAGQTNTQIHPWPTGWYGRLGMGIVSMCRPWNPFPLGLWSQSRTGLPLGSLLARWTWHLEFRSLLKVWIRIRTFRRWNSWLWRCPQRLTLHLESPKMCHFKYFRYLSILCTFGLQYSENYLSFWLLCMQLHFWILSHQHFWIKTVYSNYLLRYYHYQCSILCHFLNCLNLWVQRISKIRNPMHLHLPKTIYFRAVFW